MSDFNTLYRPRPFLSLLDTKRQVWRKLSVNKCFLAKSPVGSLPFVHREFPIVGKFPCKRGFYRARRSAGEPCSAHFIFRNDKGNPPRGISFIFRENLFVGAKIFREVILPQIFPFGKSSQKSYDSLSHLG